jgi:hypothetical protein
LTGTEIQTHANALTEGDTIDDTRALLFINECMLMDIGKDAGIIDSEEVAVEADTWAAIPFDLLEIFEIEKSGQSNPYYGSRYGIFYDGAFDLRNGYIRFPIAGTYTLWHYVLPPVLNDLDDTPAVPELFHYPMSLYMAARFKAWDDEENEDAARLMQEYNYHKKKAKETLLKTNPTTKAAKRIKTVPWR